MIWVYLILAAISIAAGWFWLKWLVQRRAELKGYYVRRGGNFH